MFTFSHCSSPEISDDDNSIAATYQAVDELPAANRDTLAFLMTHLQRLVQMHIFSVDTPISLTVCVFMQRYLCSAEWLRVETVRWM